MCIHACKCRLRINLVLQTHLADIGLLLQGLGLCLLTHGTALCLGRLFLISCHYHDAAVLKTSAPLAKNQLRNFVIAVRFTVALPSSGVSRGLCSKNQRADVRCVKQHLGRTWV